MHIPSSRLPRRTMELPPRKYTAPYSIPYSDNSLKQFSFSVMLGRVCTFEVQMLIKRHHINLNHPGKLRIRAIQVLQVLLLMALLFVSLPSKAFFHFPQGKVNGIVSRGLPAKLPSANSTQVASIVPFESVPS